MKRQMAIVCKALALGISLTLSAALAGESDGHRAKYEDYWLYCSHPFQTNAGIGYYRDLMTAMGSDPIEEKCL